MTFLELIRRAGRGYDQRYRRNELVGAINERTGRPEFVIDWAETGYGMGREVMALAVVHALYDDFKRSAKEPDQLAKAYKVLDEMIEDLQRAKAALR
jgi:hypothetical protein